MSIKQTANVTDGYETEHEEYTVYNSYASPVLDGREQIFTSFDVITRDNVIEMLNDSLQAFGQNYRDQEYLYRYIKGIQPIRDRIKKYNDHICNRIVVNRANEIVTFKTANFIGDPIQYVSRGSNPEVPAKIEMLNSFLMSENCASKDMRLAYWMFTVGVGYRLVLKDKLSPYYDAHQNGEPYDEAPFEIYVPDPRTTFVVRTNDVTQRVVAGVTFVFKDVATVAYTVYTENETFKIEGNLLRADKLVGEPVRHNSGFVPLIEYPCNALRMGAFEVVIDLLDAISKCESNRLDGVEQFIQALMVFENADITREQFLELKDLGAIKLPSIDGRSSRVYYLNEQLDQSQTQTLIDDMYQTVREIVGLPSQGNGTTSDSSNNGAALIKGGWWNAVARDKETVQFWRESNTEFLKIVLKICREAEAFDLRISDIEQKFGMKTYEDLLVKTQAFQSLIGVGAPPIQAFTISNLVADPESAAIQFEEYQRSKEEEMQERLAGATETIVVDEYDASEQNGEA